ncbi:MAG: DNA recombination protein RmuC [Alistipes sp.]|nr:DNA recombination protein RmuC [Alistipes sp.]
MTTTLLYILLSVLAVGLIGVTLLYLRGRRAATSTQERLQTESQLRQQAEAQVAAEQSRTTTAEERAERAEEQLRTLIAERATLQAKFEGAEERLREERERHTRSQAEREQAEEAMRQQFKNLATDILGEQSRSFRSVNQESIEALLKPFKQNIADFRERVEKIYATEAEQHGALKNELKHLMELNRQITTETTNLTRALKGDSKVQGDFGEMILDTILSSSQLIKGVHYTVQQSHKNEQGEVVRPDVILHLPDKKQIIIDSKTSLTAFAEYSQAEQPEERNSRMKAHLESVRKHVLELSAKNYQDLLDCSPDFVILFIPNEPAFLAAMQADPTIWADAYKRKVIISSPTNLFALLKLVDNLWQRSDLERNTRDIAECGSKIYDQLVLFSETLLGIEKGLKSAQGAYDEAYKRFTTGNNNLIRLGERMVGLNVKIKKRLTAQVLDSADLDEPDTER